MSLVSKLSGGREDIVDGIARNIEAVLNAKRGHSSVVEVFGLADHDVFDETAPRIFALAADMAEQVRRFDPRLARPRVTYAGREGSMWARFDLTGEVQGDVAGQRQSFKILFHVILRQVRVLRSIPARDPEDAKGQAR